MFRGIDEVDWVSMDHAYGSAEDVPALLRGLASPQPEERERSLDGMYGAVHHQGDVYDSTLACIPFLFALIASEDVPDRGGLVELLASIGGGTVDPQDGDEEYAASDDNCAMARAAVRSGAAVFASLVTDRDPEVRRAAPTALVRFLGEPARVLDLLRERLAEETDDRVRLALAEGLGLFARLYPASASPAVDCLVRIGAAAGEPGLRLAALGQLASCAPEHLPADLVPTVVELLRERSRQLRAPDEPERPETDTLIGHLRRLRPADEEGSQLLRTLHTALGGRVGDRIALLEGQLTSPDATDRCNAVWMSAGLFREWRASFDEPVTLIGEQLRADDERLRDAAVSVLEDLFILAVPAADHLAELAAARPESRVRHWERGAPSLGGPLKALARTGDPRAVPLLAEVLELPEVPKDIGYVIPYAGPAAAALAPQLRARLADVPVDSPETYDRAAPLLTALAALGDGAAAPDVLRLVHLAPGGLRNRDPLLAGAAHALGELGNPDAIPALRTLLHTDCAVTAAASLWSLDRDPDAVLPVLTGELTSERAHRRRAAAEALGRLGRPARSTSSALLRMLGSDDVWERTTAACALWRVTGDAEAVLPVFRAAWLENAYTRGTIASCLAELGSAGAPLHDLPHAELTNPRRHRARSGGFGSHDILEDEQLLRACREAVEDGRQGARQDGA
ncbi:HEAT repeat domain-containing protein [Streptomyces sp. NPDC005481]|uniref:HEAT repeat domain-containing protein n=1 Tax=Streptomyces sp. NPDC005481 TaxID=3154881 RepID=UPI0033A1CADE